MVWSCQRVGRVLSFFPVVGIGTPPTPNPQASVPPPLWFWGEGHTRWRERGWESPNSNEGTYTVGVVSLLVRLPWLIFAVLPEILVMPSAWLSTLAGSCDLADDLVDLT
jgi:hypothetical protein